MPSFHSLLRIVVIILSVPAGSRPVEETTSLDKRTPSIEATTPDIALPDALIAVKDTVSRVSASTGQGSIPDSTTLDDLQRLLDIIAGHVERMREATQGGGGNNTISNSNSNSNNAGKAPTEIHNKKPHPMAIPDGAVIVNHGSTDHSDNDDSSQKGELHVTSDEHGFTNITCKGISVCNPVTVISTKDGKKIKLDKLDKADKKKSKWGKKLKGGKKKDF